jgi:hypothetical protein
MRSQAENGEGEMVKRVRQEDMAGVLEFEGMTRNDPRLARWLEDHRARGGGKVRVGLGSKGLRVIFSREADLKHWQKYLDSSGKTVRAAA